MSDLLGGLRSVTQPVYRRDERGDLHAITVEDVWVKRDDVREALRNPTDAQRATAGKALYEYLLSSYVGEGRVPWDQMHSASRAVYERTACAVLASAAGGDDA